MDITRVILSNWAICWPNAKCQQIAVEIGGEIMAFINQMMNPVEDKRCGAFAIAYWFWIACQHRNPLQAPENIADDEGMVNSIYKEIRFGPNGADFDEDFSNPFKMVNYINKNYRGEYFASLKGKDDRVLELLGKLTEEDKVGINPEIVEIPNLRAGQYAILMVSTVLEREPSHYVLLEGTDTLKNGENIVKVIDPLDGSRKTYDLGIKGLNPETKGFDYRNYQTAIYITPNAIAEESE